MKGISAIIVIIMLVLLTISLTGAMYTMLRSTAISTADSAGNQINSFSKGITSTLVIDGVSKDRIYLRNVGSETFNYNISVLINNNMSCVRQDGTINSYGFLIQALIKPHEIFPIQIGCCINQGYSDISINAGMQTLTSDTSVFDSSQSIFQDWEITLGNDNSQCLVTTYGTCNQQCVGSLCYSGCSALNKNGVENYINNLVPTSNFYVSPPPYNWNISKNGGSLCCKCGWCYNMISTAKFFYNSKSFAGKGVWLAGDAPECQRNGFNGIYINDNMYVMLNGHMLFWNGTSYGGINTGSPIESKQWCIPPVDLSGSAFSNDCEWNNVTIDFEDYCQSGPQEAGGVYGMYLKAA